MGRDRSDLGNQTCGVGQNAHQLWGGVSLLEHPQFQIPVPFGQTSAVRGEQEGDMSIFGVGETQLLLKPQLSWGGGEQIAAPHYLSNPHSSIVHDHSQLVGVYAVGAAENKVTAVPGQILPTGALEQILKLDVLLDRKSVV